MSYILNGFIEDNRYLVESNNHKDSIIRLSEDEYSELKKMGIFTKTLECNSIIGTLYCEVNVYLPSESDPDFQKDSNDLYIVPMDNIGIVDIVKNPEDDEEDYEDE